jgi:hypothetical protein
MIETDDRASDALRREERIHLELEKVTGAKRSVLERANVAARNILREDIGYFGTPDANYKLDEPTRDRLLAHARQDAALAALAVVELEKAIADSYSRCAKRHWISTAVIVVSVLFAGVYL